MTVARSRPLLDPERAAAAAALGTGVLLLWSSSRFPGAIPPFGPWEFSPTLYAAIATALLAYGNGLHRLAPVLRPSRWRTVCFVLGMALIYAVTETGFGYAATHLFVATEAQQFVLHDAGPFLVALSWPGAVLRAGLPAGADRLLGAPVVRATLALFCRPIVAAAVFIALLVAAVLPFSVTFMMLDDRVYGAMNALTVADGVLFWCLVLDPRPSPPAPFGFGWRIGLAVATMLPVMPLGAYVALTTRTLYPVYDLCGRLPLLAGSSDQCLGGLMFWLPSGMMSAVAVLASLNNYRLWEEAKTEGGGGAPGSSRGSGQSPG